MSYLRVVKEGGGSRSRFMENKTVLSQFTKKLNRDFTLHVKKENVLAELVTGRFCCVILGKS